MAYSQLVPSKVDPRNLVLRMAVVRSETADDVNRSVQVVVATENPVERWDERRNGIIREVLLMKGLSFRTSKRQLPIVDSHDRSTVRNILGSVRNLRVEGDSLVGDAVFASDPESQTAYQKVKEGHITDFSVTATPSEIQFIERGQAVELDGGRMEGPADIVTRWQPTDASLVATGADPRSTVRDSLMRSYFDFPNTKKDIKRMSPETIKLLVAQGMPADLEDPEQMILWLVGKNAAASPSESAEAPESETETMMAAEVPPAASATTTTDEKPKEEEKPEEETMNAEEILKADSARRKEIQACCKQAKLERSFADDLCDRHVSIEKAKEAILNELIRQKSEGEQRPLGSSVGIEGDVSRMRFTGSADEKLEAAMRDGLVMRTITRASKVQIERSGRVRFDPFADAKPAPGHEDFMHLSLLRMADELLRHCGVSTRRMTSRQIALAAMGHEATLRGLRIQRDAYHTTGTFSNILLDAANKSLLAGYEEAPHTWTMWARQASSVADFKNINRTRFGESPDLEEVPENGDYPEGPIGDEKETYKVAKFGRVFSTTWETVVNDDLDALSRIPMLHGNAARRTVNKKVYSVLTANEAMSDGVALFHSTHGNHAGASAAPSETTLNAMFVAMMTQTGTPRPDGSAGPIIGVTPKYIIGPPSRSAAIIQLLTSMTPPTVGGSAAGTSGIQNMYGPGGERQLIPVIESQLEAASATTWYGAADYNQMDTVEVTFLQGEETPVIESEWDFDKDGWKSKVRQTFGVKAINWRGLWVNMA